jgi:hypothetical protein
LILEFNYDPTMLSEGPYPWISSEESMAPKGICQTSRRVNCWRRFPMRDLKWLVLAHLSETNNHADKALEAAKGALDRCGLKETRVLVGRQDAASPFIEL